MQIGYNFRLSPFNVYLSSTIQQELTFITEKSHLKHIKPPKMCVLQDSCRQLFNRALKVYERAPPQEWIGLFVHQAHSQKKV